MDSEAYYYGLRTIARKRAMDEINCRISRDGGASAWNGTDLASMCDEAVQYAETIWPEYYNEKHQGFEKSWSSIWQHAQYQPARFDIAIWQTFNGSRILQGMATGTASSGREHLTLNWVERNFGPEYLRFGVLVPILLTFEHYGRLLGVNKLLIKNPVDPSIYKKYGYAPMTIKGAKSDVAFLGKEI